MLYSYWKYLTTKYEPKKENISQIQPCKLPETIPPNNAPILQPKAKRAPRPKANPDKINLI